MREHSPHTYDSPTHGTPCRSAALERALQTVVSNGLRAGWLNLGHHDTEVQRIIGELPGQPFALRKRDGSDADDDGKTVDMEGAVADQARSAPPPVDPPVDHEAAQTTASNGNLA